MGIPPFRRQWTAPLDEGTGGPLGKRTGDRAGRQAPGGICYGGPAMISYPLITLVAVAIGGLAAAELFRLLPLACMLAALVALVALGLQVRRGRQRPIRWRYGLVFIGFFLWGQFAALWLPGDHLSHRAGERLLLSATVVELPRLSRAADGSGRERFLARADAITVDGAEQAASGLVRISRYLNPGDAPLAAGERFMAPVTLKPIHSLHNPGGYDYAAFQARQGVRVRASISRKATLTRLAPAAGPWAAVHHWRERMREAIHAALPRDRAALLTALSIGDGRGLPDHLRERFQAAGLAHVLAISGTHLGLVAGVVFWLVRWGLMLLPARLLARLTTRITARTLAGTVALVTVTGYALLSGGRVPTVRALIMVWMVTLALLLGRRGHTPTALAAAGLLILLWDPLALGSASFQLSFTAVMAILLALSVLPAPKAPPGEMPPLGQRLRTAVIGTVLVTLSAGAATAPLVAYHFGQVSWPGFVANLILVPLLGAVVLPFSLLAAVLAPALGHLPMAGEVDWLLAAFIDGVGRFAALPGALTHVAKPPGLLVLAGFGAVALIIAGRRRLHPGAIPIGILCLGLAWWVALFPPRPEGRYTIAFLDVGQGDAAVITGPGDGALVIDGGTRFGRFDIGRLVLAPYLWQQGIHHLTLIATHPQIDHAGGLIYLIDPQARRFTIDRYYDNGQRRAGARFDGELHRSLTRLGQTATPLYRGQPLDVAPFSAAAPPLAARVLWPPSPPSGTPRAEADNNDSLVIALTVGLHRFLFTGDIEQPTEAALLAAKSPLAATVLKVPHHGSGSSSGDAFIRAVSPALAVISAGFANPYGHPRQTVLDRYRAAAIPTLVTADSGAVLLRTDGRSLRMVTGRDLSPQPVIPFANGALAAERRNLMRLFAPRLLWRGVAPPTATGSP